MTRIPPILVVLVGGVLAALSVMQVRFSSDLYRILPQDLPEVRGMEQLDRFFSRHGQLIVTVRGEAPWAVEEASVSLADHLRAHPDQVAEVFRELSPEELVTAGGELLAWTWLNAEPESLAELGERLQPGRSRDRIAESLAIVQEGVIVEKAFLAGYDPLALSRISDDPEGEGASRADPMRSEDGTFAVLYVEGRGADFSDYRAAKKWLDRMHAVVSEWEDDWRERHGAEASIVTGLTGTPAFMGEVGTQMEKDMTISVVATLVLISLLFYLMHRRLRPLSWLLAAMLLVLALTLTAGGLLYGDLSVMSVGFAAILMGLAVDYGIVLYREAMDSGGGVREVRRRVGPAILWAAATTAVVFLSLNLSSLPGLAEMGNLVAIGVVAGAAVMLLLFAPVAVGFNRDAGRRPVGSRRQGGSGGRSAIVLAVVIPVLAGVSLLVGERPALEANFHPFRIRESPAMKAWKEMQTELRGEGQAVPAIVTAPDLTELHRGLASLEGRLAAAKSAGLVRGAMLPTDWIPNPAHQQRNAATIRALLEERSRLLSEIDEGGFSEAGAALTVHVFDAWTGFLEALRAREVVLPEGGLAKWAVDRIFRERDGEVAALAAVEPAVPRDRRWVEAVCADGVTVASLGSLGTALNERIRGDLTRVFLPMTGLLILMLSIVYRSWRDLVLSLAALVFSGAVLIILTVWTPLSWNSFNVCGLPLLFGTGLDFSIHMIFALRRGGGSVEVARRGMGRAVVFCGASSAIGFGSLATASAHGLSSLGIVCAAGILVNMIVAVGLLPHWYRKLHKLRD